MPPPRSPGHRRHPPRTGRLVAFEERHSPLAVQARHLVAADLERRIPLRRYSGRRGGLERHGRNGPGNGAWPARHAPFLAAEELRQQPEPATRTTRTQEWRGRRTPDQGQPERLLHRSETAYVERPLPGSGHAAHRECLNRPTDRPCRGQPINKRAPSTPTSSLTARAALPGARRGFTARLRGLPGIRDLQRRQRSHPVPALPAGGSRDRRGGEQQALPFRAALPTRRALRHRRSDPAPLTGAGVGGTAGAHRAFGCLIEHASHSTTAERQAARPRATSADRAGLAPLPRSRANDAAPVCWPVRYAAPPLILGSKEVTFNDRRAAPPCCLTIAPALGAPIRLPHA